MSYLSSFVLQMLIVHQPRKLWPRYIHTSLDVLPGSAAKICQHVLEANRCFHDSN